MSYGGFGNGNDKIRVWDDLNKNWGQDDKPLGTPQLSGAPGNQLNVALGTDTSFPLTQVRRIASDGTSILAGGGYAAYEFNSATGSPNTDVAYGLYRAPTTLTSTSSVPVDTQHDNYYLYHAFADRWYAFSTNFTNMVLSYTEVTDAAATPPTYGSTTAFTVDSSSAYGLVEITAADDSNQTYINSWKTGWQNTPMTFEFDASTGSIGRDWIPPSGTAPNALFYDSSTGKYGGGGARLYYIHYGAGFARVDLGDADPGASPEQGYSYPSGYTADVAFAGANGATNEMFVVCRNNGNGQFYPLRLTLEPFLGISTVGTTPVEGANADASEAMVDAYYDFATQKLAVIYYKQSEARLSGAQDTRCAVFEYTGSDFDLISEVTYPEPIAPPIVTTGQNPREMAGRWSQVSDTEIWFPLSGDGTNAGNYESSYAFIRVDLDTGAIFLWNPELEAYWGPAVSDNNFISGDLVEDGSGDTRVQSIRGVPTIDGTTTNSVQTAGAVYRYGGSGLEPSFYPLGNKLTSSSTSASLTTAYDGIYWNRTNSSVNPLDITLSNRTTLPSGSQFQTYNVFVGDLFGQRGADGQKPVRIVPATGLIQGHRAVGPGASGSGVDAQLFSNSAFEHITLTWDVGQARWVVINKWAPWEWLEFQNEPESTPVVNTLYGGKLIIRVEHQHTAGDGICQLELPGDDSVGRFPEHGDEVIVYHGQVNSYAEVPAETRITAADNTFAIQNGAVVTIRGYNGYAHFIFNRTANNNGEWVLVSRNDQDAGDKHDYATDSGSASRAVSRDVELRTLVVSPTTGLTLSGLARHGAYTYAVFVDGNGGNGSIVKYPSYATVGGTGALATYDFPANADPVGCVVDSEGNVWTTNPVASGVVKLDADLNLINTYTTSKVPTGINYAQEGGVFVSTLDGAARVRSDGTVYQHGNNNPGSFVAGPSAFDGKFFWVSQYNTGTNRDTLHSYDNSGDVEPQYVDSISELAHGSQVKQIAFDGKRLWISLDSADTERANLVWVTPIRRYEDVGDVEQAPRFYGPFSGASALTGYVAFDGKYIWLTATVGGNPGYVVLDPSSGIEVATIDMGGDNYTPEYPDQFKAFEEGIVAVFNRTSGAIEYLTLDFQKASKVSIVHPNAITSATTLPEAHGMSLHKVDSTGGAFTVTHDGSPAHGDRVVLKDVGNSAAANNVTFSGNGKAIIGTAVLATNNGSQGFTFDESSDSWLAD